MVGSWARLSSTMRTAYITVEWSRPPNFSAILPNDASAMVRLRYIAIWRGKDDGSAPAMRRQILQPTAEMLADGLLYGFDGDHGLCDDAAPATPGRGVQVEWRAVHGCRGDEARERTLNLAYGGAAAFRHQACDIFRQFTPWRAAFLSHDRHAHLRRRRVNVGNQPAFKAASQALFQLGNGVRRFVRRQHHLASGRVERIERVEELLLRTLLSGQELHVVEDEHVELTETVAERCHLVLPQARDQRVHEGLGGQRRDATARRTAEQLVRQRIDQVRLAKPTPPHRKTD